MILAIVTTKSIDMIYVGQEYTVDDFVEIENSYGEEFGVVTWAKGAYDDTSNIIISEDKKSFQVLEGDGQIHIQIWVHESHYSDMQTVALNVNVNKSVE